MFKFKNKFVKLIIIVSLFVLLVPQGIIHASASTNPTLSMKFSQGEDYQTTESPNDESFGDLWSEEYPEASEIIILEVVTPEDYVENNSPGYQRITIPARFFLTAQPQKYHRIIPSERKGCVRAETGGQPYYRIVYHIPLPSNVYVYHAEVWFHDTNSMDNLVFSLVKHYFDGTHSLYKEFEYTYDFSSGLGNSSIVIQDSIYSGHTHVLEVKMPGAEGVQFCGATVWFQTPDFRLFGLDRSTEDHLSSIK